MVATNQTWLDRVDEAILDPELPICDPHHHLWDFRPGGTVESRYLMDDILADVGCGHNVVSTVFIECGTLFDASKSKALAVGGETEFVNGIAAMSASGLYGQCRIAAGIVGTAYLSEGDSVAQVLDRQIAAGNGRFRGIRQAASWDASPAVENHRTNPPADLYSEEKFREGFAHLGPRNLTFEGWCYHTQIRSLARLARDFPDTTIILDHFGGPIGVGPYAGKRDEVFSQWKASIEVLSQSPNVMAKLGGLGMPVMGFGWHERETPPTSSEFLEPTRPYFEYMLECFGVERCMFQSNFPVDKVSVSYKVLWNAFKRLSAGFTDDERASLFHDTAARVYGL